MTKTITRENASTQPPPYVQGVSFTDLGDYIVSRCKAIVILGCGGDLNKWVQDITSYLEGNDIIKGDSSSIWSTAYRLETTGGRIDLVLALKADIHVDTINYDLWLAEAERVISATDYVNVFHHHHDTELKNLPHYQHFFGTG